jgi:hypothetical protein
MSSRQSAVLSPLLIAAAAVISLRVAASAQSFSYTKGQNIAPAYEGWEQAPDGTKYFLFGYMNRNWEEEIDVPVGPDNGFNLGSPDQGQPTHFLPRRNRFVFRVPVPSGFTEKDELIWTLTTKGKSEKAYATLRIDYQIDDVVKASETGALGAGTSSPEVRANKRPAVTLEGPKTRIVKVGQPLTLVAVATDDGVPKPRDLNQVAAFLARSAAAAEGGAAAPGAGRGADPSATPAAPSPARRNPAMLPPIRITVGKNLGLHLSWFVYRGTGKVTFNPEQIRAWEDTRAGANSPWAPVWAPPPMPADGKLTVEASFDEPGTYVLRGLADDGALLANADVTVTVTR